MTLRKSSHIFIAKTWQVWSFHFEDLVLATLRFKINGGKTFIFL